MINCPGLSDKILLCMWEEWGLSQPETGPKAPLRGCVKIFQASSSRDRRPLGAFVNLWSVLPHTHCLLMDHTTERFIYCQEHTLKFKKCWCSQYSWIKPRKNKGCIFDHFLIYVHLTYLMSSQKEPLTRALLGFLKDYSTERPVELVLVKLNKKSFPTQTTLGNATDHIFFLEIHTSTLKSLTSPTIKKPV